MSKWPCNLPCIYASISCCCCWTQRLLCPAAVLVRIAGIHDGDGIVCGPLGRPGSTLDLSILTERYKHLERPQLLPLNHGKRGAASSTSSSIGWTGTNAITGGSSDGEFSLSRAGLSRFRRWGPDASLVTVVPDTVRRSDIPYAQLITC
jgi:hypothetical protein